MYIKRDYDFNELFQNSWSGAIDSLKEIEKNDKENELMEFLEVVFSESVPTETEVNDFLWFESDYIYKSLGMSENEEEEEE